MVAPGLEVPAVLASPVARPGRRGASAGARPTTRTPLIAARLGQRRPGSALANRMWAEQVLRLRAALPGAEQALASGGARRAADAQEPRGGRRAAPGRRRRSTGCTPGWPSSCGPAAPSARPAATSPTAILAEGHATVDFVIVGSGPNGASPAPRGRRPGDRAPATPVVVDIGGTTPEGYCSDCTRMYALGEPPAEFADYLRGAARGPAAPPATHARPGVTAESVDAAAREVIDGRRLRRRLHPPHRPRHRRRDPRGALHRRRATTDRARAGHGVLDRAGHLPAGPARRPDRGHRRRPPRTASSGSTSPTATTSSLAGLTAHEHRRSVTCPTEEAPELLDLTRELVREELAPRAAAYEADSRFPREVFRTLGKAGLLGCPTPRSTAAAASRTRSTCRSSRSSRPAGLTVAEGVSVHTLACFPLAAYGTDEQRDALLPDMLGGELLGAYCLSEPQSGSDAAALTTRAVRDGDDYVVNGTKAWITHGGEADFYTPAVPAPSDDGAARHLLPAGRRATRRGCRAAEPERKMGFTGSTDRPGRASTAPGSAPTG